MRKFSTKKGNDGQYYFNLLDKNGQVILIGEAYTSIAAMHGGIASVKKNAAGDKHYEWAMSNNKKFYFNLKALNGEIIGTSPMYETEVGRDNGMESVKKNAPEAPIVNEY
ncbi:YegP family protein [Mucilaginibacter sp. FT3.2]|uniref:YegP family protein n=1 Tax=Mucilaginibacter sp. FT3.2 TaxID=2723090 RepID=UPI00160C8A14|nr:YegP family protein [Mucilaginibacter sp. FT3.2]MBB6235313.1 hypothetical protein [Mucilaginibacter sp. FT3.2]